MDLHESPEDRAYRATVRAWFEQNVPGTFSSLEDKRAWHKRLYNAGYIGMGWPREFGGQGARPIQQAIVAEEMARAGAPGGINNLAIGFIGPTLIEHGTQWQKERFVRNMLTADELWCQLYSEPGSGSDLASLRTTAERRGDTYIVNGQKVWTSQGMVADYAILLARTDPSVPKHKGITKFVINMRQPGVDVRPLRQITGHAEFCEVFMTNAEVPVEYRVGEDGQGWELAQTTLGYERGGSLLSRVARGRVQLQRLIDVCKTLPRNGGVAIDDSLVRQRLAKMLSELEILRYAGLRILSRLEKGQRPGPESSVDKLYYSEMDKRHQEWIQEILGPHALLWDGEEEAVAMEGRTQSGDDASWAYSYLWSRAGTIYSGSSEIQKNIIGERVLKLPREIRADRMATRS